MPLEKLSPCKVNLLLNILEKRQDGFHELETVMHPVPVFDRLEFSRGGATIDLTCNVPELPVDSGNLVYRAAATFLGAAGIKEGLRIHLEKRLPLAAGLGGGSANAAITLVGLNELFGQSMSTTKLAELAASLGSDVPFFLQTQPALATGRGEKVEPLEFFPALEGCWLLLIHPGFGISTAWAYQSLARFPLALHGTPGRARELITRLRTPNLASAAPCFYNSLETPALQKFPILALFQEFLRQEGAIATLMSGSGSTTFAVAENRGQAEALMEKFRSRFGQTNWTTLAELGSDARS